MESYCCQRGELEVYEDILRLSIRTSLKLSEINVSHLVLMACKQRLNLLFLLLYSDGEKF